MPDFVEIIDGIKAILELIFGDQVPTWIFTAIGYILLVALFLIGVWSLLFVLSKIKVLWVEHFLPLFYNSDEKRRRRRRRRFAGYIWGEIYRLDNLEAWSDYRFTELEAEVEAEGLKRAFSLPPFFRRSQSDLRRERSLSRALKTSRERLILLEGEPGSGKSVALRHVTQLMAHRAMRSRNVNSVIPIYVNLKELERAERGPIDGNLIYTFVLKTLNRANDRDIEEFLEDEFDRGLQEGTWLFFFDSFDEIPDILSSVEADEIIRDYAGAISDFLHGMNQCRGVVASRQFRGPGMLGWPRFRILPLKEDRRRELIRRADLGREMEGNLVGQLGVAPHGIRTMASNPMFLGLVCDYVRGGNPFPENAHSVFESYIGNRLTRDRERLRQRYGLDLEEVRKAAERVAFCMAADPGLLSRTLIAKHS
jgi:hypothetical protein